MFTIFGKVKNETHKLVLLYHNMATLFFFSNAPPTIRAK